MEGGFSLHAAYVAVGVFWAGGSAGRAFAMKKFDEVGGVLERCLDRSGDLWVVDGVRSADVFHGADVEEFDILIFTSCFVDAHCEFFAWYEE